MDARAVIQQHLTRVAASVLDDDVLILTVTDVADALLRLALDQRSASERRQAAQLARLVTDEAGKQFTVALCDRAFRSNDPRLVARTWRRLLQRCGVPQSPAWWQRWGLQVGAIVARIIPAPVVALLDGGLRRETARVILPAEDRPLRRHLAQRRAQGVRENLNHLGEAVLGEHEAAARVAAYRALLRRDDVAYVSVKVSAMCSQIDSLACDRSVQEVVERLVTLYRDAQQHTWCDAHGQRHPKWVNLDVEEYRDLALTVAAFTQALDRPECQQARAGIAIQAYLPDSWPVLQQLTEWASQRAATGGSQPKIRLVKGANLLMERVESGHHGWQAAPYATKAEVDANYKRLLDFALQTKHAKVLRVGVASHNIFDVAYALVRRAQYSSQADVEFEMLEGMADHQARAVAAVAGDILLYAPVVERNQVRSAIAYLVRRLDENTDPANFLAQTFAMQPGDTAWQGQQAAFAAAVRDRHTVHAQPRRQLDRTQQQAAVCLSGPYRAAPDSDWTLASSRAWIQAACAKARATGQEIIPAVIAGAQRVGDSDDTLIDGLDPSDPSTRAYRWTPITRAEVEVAVACAAEQLVQPGSQRALLLQCAQALEHARGELIAAAVMDGGKTVREADGEISETIDFATWYARSLDDPGWFDGATAQARGVVVVAPPWNFPISIAAGGVLAALAAGNAVILKPPPETVLAAWHLVQCLWQAGVSRQQLQFAPSRDDEVGQALISHPNVAVVILTGATSTARLFQQWRPQRPVFAETGGKNALIISPNADRDLAAKDLVASAFGHAGQKCSAASLGILIGEVATDANFLHTLIDAAASLPVGSVHDWWHRVPPLIRPPGPELQRALTLTSADSGRWLLAPRQRDEHGYVWSPGIRGGVQPGDWLQQTECFGPVLGLIAARDLDHAIAIANSSPYGLTGGLHSLDEAEQLTFIERIQVGNIYINRGITGAVVARQPFGGWKASNFGPGAKAGGPNYVAQLAQWSASAQLPTASALLSPTVADLLALANTAALSGDDLAWLRAAAQSDSAAQQNYFQVRQRWAPVPGEDNVFRYRGLPSQQAPLLRLEATDSSIAGWRFALGARCCGQVARISADPVHRADLAVLGQHTDVAVTIEDSVSCAASLNRLQPARVRCVSQPQTALAQAAAEHDIALVTGPLLANGRHELRTWLREQAISLRYHRYGNPGLGSVLADKNSYRSASIDAGCTG